KETFKTQKEKKALIRKQPQVLQYDSTKLPDNMEHLAELKEKMDAYEDEFKRSYQAWQKQLEHPGLISIQYNNNYNSFLLKQRKYAIEQRYIEFNRYIDTVDHYLHENYQHIEQLYRDSMEAEIIPKELYDLAKQMQALDKIIEDELRMLQMKQVINNAEEIEVYYDGLVFSYFNQLETGLLEANEHRAWVLANLPTVEKDWKELKKLSKIQPKLNKQKMKFLEEQQENDHKREVNLAEMVMDQTDKWAKEMEDRF
ncbi:MAG: hypothetical protein ACPF8V_06310, partial [Luteibaculum sp.]